MGAEVPDFAGTDRFRVVRRLGSGGMGVVYEAWDAERQATVALKQLRKLSGDHLLLFKNEFRALQGILHRNLVGLGELIEDHGQWLLSMELVLGQPFLQWVRVAAAGAVDAAAGSLATERFRVVPIDEEPPTLPVGQRGQRAIGEASDVGRFDEGRLRDGLAQIAHGLSALHAHGKVHRDIKPSNILVTADGRVVILDFGLVVEADTRRPEVDVVSPERVVGTPAYMAPEQAGNHAVGPAADWYAVGTILYRALTGRLPFLGTAHDIVRAKQRVRPIAPSVIRPGAPPELEALCMALLAIAPQERPGGREVLLALGAGDPGADLGRRDGDELIGRAGELAQLDRALADAVDAVAPASGGPIAIAVRGDSGVGKSTLVAHWAARVAASPGALVLSGRCYERESVPYKAIDGVLDALGRALAGWPTDEVAALAPRRIALVCRVFPALVIAPGLARAAALGVGRGDGPIAPASARSDAVEERRQLFEALRDLLGALAARRRLVMCIDDLQWADADSRALLAALLRGPGAPRLLLVTTIRDAADGGELGDSGLALPCEQRVVELGGLPPADAVALAQRLLPAQSRDQAATIAAETDGHPLFVMELARAQGSAGGPRARHVEDALWRRIEVHDDDDRRLLAVVALAGQPIAQETAALAAGVELARLVPMLARLRDGNLIRTGGPARADAVEVYHSRIRAAVLGHLSTEARRSGHRGLAEALEQLREPDASVLEALYAHWAEAGCAERARGYAVRSAAAAAAALAFERAARLYRGALALGPGPDETHRLQLGLGQALVDGGRGAEAARVLREAADGAEAREARDLRRRAAEHLLRAGHVDEGLDQMRAVLEDVGFHLPASGRRALPALLRMRFQLRLRGLTLRRGVVAEVETLDRIDALWSASVGVSMIDAVRGASFATRMLLLALRAGDPARASLALSLEAGLLGASGVKAAPQVERVLGMARQLAVESGNGHAMALVEGAIGMAAFLQGRFAAALPLNEHAAELLRRDCPGATWERDTVIAAAAWSRVYLGEFDALTRSLPTLLREADERDDRYAATSLRSGTLVWLPLALADPATARANAVTAMSHWSHRAFLHQHWDDLMAHSEIDLYEGDAAAALARVTGGWRDLKRAFVLAIQVSRVEATFLRGRAALARAAQLRPSGSSDEARLRAAARADARRLFGERGGWASGFGELLAAGAAAGSGNSDQAVAGLRRALERFVGAGMTLHAAVVRQRLAEQVGGAEGAELAAAVEAYLASQPIRGFERLCAVLAPGFGA